MAAAAVVAPASIPSHLLGCSRAAADEDPFNVHRDKAQVLLRMAHAVEDSTQRRRKVASSYNASKYQDSPNQSQSANSLLVQDLNQLASDLHQGEEEEEEKTPEDTDPTSCININITLQNVLTSVYNLREHSHLKYQMLELKYFDLKRHVFDVEAQNRRLRLEHLHQMRPLYASTSTTTTTTTKPPSENKQMVQLQQDNSDLRKQLQDNCGECRRLVQENYGLRKILLDAGVSPQKIRLAASTKLQEGRQEESSSENDDEGFEDCQEFDSDVDDQEKTPEPVISPHVSLLEGETHPHSMDTNSGTLQSTAIPSTSRSPSILRDSSGDSAAAEDRASTATTTTTTTTDSTPRQKRGSRKSVTFAAMATALVKDRPGRRISSSQSVISYDSAASSLDGRSVATAPPSMLRCHHNHTKDQQQHDKNLALLGGIFSASSKGSKPERDSKCALTNSQSQAVAAQVALTPPPRRKSYAAPQSSRKTTSTSSSSSSRQKDKFQQQQTRRYSHGDALRTYHNHAMCAKDFQKSQPLRFSNKKKGNTFQIHMSSLMSSKTSSKKNNSVVQDDLSPEENSRRLSELLGGFRPGTIAIEASSVKSSISMTKQQQQPASRRKSTSHSMFGRRRSSKGSSHYNNAYNDDDDNMSVGSARSLGSYLFGSKKKKKAVAKATKQGSR